MNPLIPTLWDTFVTVSYLSAATLVSVATLAVLWIAVVPKRRRQVRSLLARRR